MKTLLFGASGMIGMGVLLECLADARVESVLAVGRRPCGVSHPKLREWLLADLGDYADAADALRGHDAVFYCVGVSSAGMSEPEYSRVTVALALAAAQAIAQVSPGVAFCFVSGEGADSSERGRIMWARVKGRAENELFRLPLEVYVFRPGYVQPRKGVRSRTSWYLVFYALAGPLYPLLRRLAPRHVTTTEHIGRAMIEVAANGYPYRVLGNADINVAGAHEE